MAVAGSWLIAVWVHEWRFERPVLIAGFQHVLWQWASC